MHGRLKEEMKRIPASYIPTSIRTDLSQILDYPCNLHDNDYRYFAERNGLTPQIVQWLDSQKTQFLTSSICAVLDYLTKRDKDRFTVYDVYKTLYHMNSDGQRVILEGMPEIRRLHNQSTRPGQENSEPPSVNVPPHPPPPEARPHYPPPQYNSIVSQHSFYMAGGEGAVGFNDLDLGCSPGVVNPRPHLGGHNGYHRGAEEIDFIPPSDPAQQDRFNRSDGSDFSTNSADGPCPCGNPQPGRREAAENSSSFNGTEDGGRASAPSSPPSYDASEFYHHMGGHPGKGSTEIQELKLPLPGPAVNPGSCSVPGQLRNSQRNIPMNIPPTTPGCRGYEVRPRPSPSRPDSYPKRQPASCRCQRCTPRPVSDNALYCPHSGACTCVFQDDCGPSSIGSQLSAGHPWNEGHHQTDVKQPLGSLSSRFVFVVAGDLEETDRLDQQVEAFCRSLEARRIGYVVVSSRSQQPLVALAPSVIEDLPPLTASFRSVQKFVWSCYRRASKVMMLITPGYLRYADAFTEGAEKALTYQQKLIRKIQESLKKEFFNRETPLRIWPVLLHQTKANRAHLPYFLSDTVFYWFPLLSGAENVMEILREDLSSRSPDVKRSI